jgi:hypothetical protein
LKNRQFEKILAKDGIRNEVGRKVAKEFKKLFYCFVKIYMTDCSRRIDKSGGLDLSIQAELYPSIKF